MSGTEPAYGPSRRQHTRSSASSALVLSLNREIRCKKPQFQYVLNKRMVLWVYYYVSGRDRVYRAMR
eukprot:2767724-Rhodomonas_salina.10